MKWLIILTLLFSFSSDAQMRRRVHAASGPAYQALRPSGDVSTNGWISTGGNFYDQINEEVANDATYIIGIVESSGSYLCNLSAGTDPSIHTGHVLHIRILSMDVGVIAACTVVDATNGAIQDVSSSLSVGDNAITLETTSVAQITNYATLKFEIDYDTGGDPGVTIPQVSQVWLEVPNP